MSIANKIKAQGLTRDDMQAFESLESMGKIAYLVSVPNPKQVGTKDCWLAYIKPPKLKEI